MVDKPSSKLSVVLEMKSPRSHTSDGRQKIGVRICFSVNTRNCMCIVATLHLLNVSCIILLHEKFLQFDWLRAVVFQLNLKYLHVKITTFCG